MKMIIKNSIFSMIFWKNGKVYKCLCKLTVILGLKDFHGFLAVTRLEPSDCMNVFTAS
jgi:hypothetical protein